MRLCLYICAIAALTLWVSGCGSNSGQNALKRGIAAYHAGNYGEAITQLTKASQRVANNDDLYYYLGCAHLRNGEMDQAAYALGVALDLNGRHSETLATLGQLAYHTDNLVSAQNLLLKALEGDMSGKEGRSSVYNCLALVELGLKQPEMALLYLLRAMHVQQYYPAAIYNLATLLLNSYELREEALDQFEIFVRVVDAGSPYKERAANQIKRLRPLVERSRSEERGKLKRDPERALKQLQEGISAQSEKQFSRAIRHYREALAADPLNFNAAYGLGIMHRRQNFAGEALEAFQRASNINPGHQDSLLQAAEMALRLRRFELVATLLAQAIGRNPLYPRNAELLAQLAAARNRPDTARACGEFYLLLLPRQAGERAAFEKWLRQLPER